ncbi:hypothetical protein XBLMG947_3622 [Xanthomonas bromi]|uniref:Uncharacterized protein n=1 Tax=Xanthomonas bromi TaxID=56449 RepID=A0A1C3NQZ0_9XANT|nr:hypothetical protein XBLMG947_3622 [Xanthomonas bromi]
MEPRNVRPSRSKAEVDSTWIAPPMESPGMSGVGDLTTFRRSVESDGITSSGAERVPSSGVPMVMPSMVTLLSDASRPRMTTKRPSP